MERAVAARKNITIDLEAYERLRALRRDKESISQVIMRVVRPPFDIAGFPAQGESISLGKTAFADMLHLGRGPGTC